MPNLETKIFNAGGTKLLAKSATSTFKGFRADKSTFKILIELSFDAELEKLREFTDFKTPPPPSDAPGWVYFERYDPTVPQSQEIEKAEVSLIHNADDIVSVNAVITLSGGGKTQSGS